MLKSKILFDFFQTLGNLETMRNNNIEVKHELKALLLFGQHFGMKSSNEMGLLH